VIIVPGGKSDKSYLRLRGSPLVQFFCEVICPNCREFMRKFFEFAPRGAFQARILGDFSPFLAKPGICLRRNIAFSCGSAVCRAPSFS
jgi:hypothetical protein